ncbi:hypothetical protein EV426DRAFT_572591 [Tirmania nivea]|nr:hypothetical protein EV426DRAFT_572591 [Tirmania nivea]
MSTSAQPALSTPTSTAEPEPSKKMEFWRAVCESMTAPPQIDFEKFAKLAGYKNAISARASYNREKRGLDKDKSEGSVVSAKATKEPKASKPAGNAVAKKRNRKPKVQVRKEVMEKKEAAKTGKKVKANSVANKETHNESESA